MERRAMRAELAIDGSEGRMKEFRRRERQLITLARCSRLPWTASIQPLARAPGSAQLLIEIVGNPGAQSTRPRLVRRDQPLAGSLDEEHLRGIEEEIGRLGWLGHAGSFRRRRESGSMRNRCKQRGGGDDSRSADGGHKRTP